MEEPEVEKQTTKEKLLFYTTAFFILLGTFSLFAFLFLVPFVIEPAFKTIFMEFVTSPTMCVTAHAEEKSGITNCSWTSCREGCTKELFKCIQITVNYRLNMSLGRLDEKTGEEGNAEGDEEADMNMEELAALDSAAAGETENEAETTRDFSFTDPWFGLMEYGTFNESDWFIDARLFPNVKGCGYPPFLECKKFQDKYQEKGTNFTCFYSKIDPMIVITELDMDQVYMNLIYSMAIPIPSFIVSCIYLWVAYFKIYNEDDEPPLDTTIVPSESVHSETNKDVDGQVKASDAEETKEQEAFANANSNGTG